AVYNRARAGNVNDVVVLFYHGGEVPGVRDTWLRGADEQDPISFTALARRFGDNLGAQLLLLEVGRPPAQALPAEARDRDLVRSWAYDPPVSLLRYAWLGAGKAAEPRMPADLEKALRDKRLLGEVVEWIGGQQRPKDLAYYGALASGQKELRVGSGK